MDILKSSAFVPANWKIGPGVGGVVNLVSGIVRAVDHQIVEEDASPIFHQKKYSRQGRKEHRGIPTQGDHSAHRNNRVPPNRSVNTAYYDQRQAPRAPSTSAVSIINDKHSLFTKEMLKGGVLLRGSHARITDDSVMARCPRCLQRVMTVVQRKISAKNIAATATVTVVGIMANAFVAMVPLALAALDLSPLKNKIHYCAYCNYEFGKHVTVSIPKPTNSQINSELHATSSSRHRRR